MIHPENEKGINPEGMIHHDETTAHLERQRREGTRIRPHKTDKQSAVIKADFTVIHPENEKGINPEGMIHRDETTARLERQR